ncbi:MAG: response regulator [Saccharospirillaceae bacterium]|nr:ATP-binding protein [Pseudomonadales bacterium]NRB80254.1 response regulator [Saccharospirillaceae bacterium]
MQIIQRLKVVLLIMSLLIVSLNSKAQVDLIGDDIYPLIDEITWRYALENESTWEQLLNNKQSKWLKSPNSALALGFINNIVWVKLEINVTKFSNSDNYILDLGNPTLLNASLLHILPNLYTEEFGPIGMAFPFGSSRYIYSDNNHFNLDLSLLGTHSIYLRLDQDGYFDLPLQLQTPKSAFNSKLESNFYANIFYGFLLALTFYHLFYFFIIRDPIYLSYLFFTTGITLLFGNLDGILFQHIWPNTPIINGYTAKLSTPLISLSIILLCLNFLHIKKVNKWFYIFSRSILIINILLFPISLLITTNISSIIGLSILLLTLICVPIFSIVHYILYRNPVSLVFLLSSTFLLVICITIILSMLGLTPIDVNNLWDTLKIAMCLQMLVFASAIAFRVRIINKEKNNAIQESNQKSEIIAQVSHELRTPLNGILGLSHIMAPLLNNAQTKSYNNMIHQSATALLTVINDLLEVSRINAGKFSIVIHPTDIHDLINSVATSLFSQLDSKTIGSINIDKQVPKFALTDADRLRQLMSNLLGNSIKFTQSGSIQLSVTPIIDKTNEVDLYRFEIKDTGDGISPEDLDRIFKPYEQVKDQINPNNASTGLGLFITHQLSKAMNTKIEVISELKKGSTFWFDLHLEKCDPITEKPLEKSLSDTVLNILVAEDNNINQLIINKLITNLGHNVTIANNGQEALDLLKSNTFDFVFMDCDMPILDGYQAVKQYREFEKETGRAYLTIYALTAHAYQGHDLKIKQHGMDGQILKPIKPIEIESILNSLA